MKFGKSKSKLKNDPNRAPAQFRSECVGEKCPNWKGQPCAGVDNVWRSAKATVTEGRDTSQPPFKEEAMFVTYAQLCMGTRNRLVISYSVDDHDNGHFFHDETGLIVHADSRFRDLDVSVFKVGTDENGQRTQELTAFYDGWG